MSRGEHVTSRDTGAESGRELHVDGEHLAPDDCIGVIKQCQCMAILRTFPHNIPSR